MLFCFMVFPKCLRFPFSADMYWGAKPATDTQQILSEMGKTLSEVCVCVCSWVVCLYLFEMVPLVETVCLTGCIDLYSTDKSTFRKSQINVPLLNCRIWHECICSFVFIFCFISLSLFSDKVYFYVLHFILFYILFHFILCCAVC